MTSQPQAEFLDLTPTSPLPDCALAPAPTTAIPAVVYERAQECIVGMIKPQTERAANARGPYAGARTRYKAERPANYFRPEHEGDGRFISWAGAVDRGIEKIYVSYKFANDSTIYRTPRSKSVWFDDQGIEFARLDIQRWKDANNNSIGVGKLLPSFYLSHRRDYLRWLQGRGNAHMTIQRYESILEANVFPYFVGKLKLTDPKKWDSRSTRSWEAFLLIHVPDAATRNRIKTGLRRYLKFLFAKTWIDIVPTIFNEPELRDTNETPIPGELPRWEYVEAYFRRMPPGRMRFIKGIEAAFGTRVSEAIEVEEADLFGAESEEFIDQRNDFVRKVKDAGFGALFLNVDRARKRTVKPEILKMLGADEDDQPKSGRYTACCTNEGMARFILEMIKNGEHLGDVRYDQVNKFRNELPFDDSPYRFHEYRDHDYRRLQITLQVLDLDIEGRIDVCCYLHAHHGQDVFRRYFQWGAMQRRKQGAGSRAPLQIFKTKRATPA